MIEQEMRVTGSDGIKMVPFYTVEGPIAARIMHNMDYVTRRSQEMIDKLEDPYTSEHHAAYYREQAFDYMLNLVRDFYLLTGEIIEHDWESIAAYWD